MSSAQEIIIELEFMTKQLVQNIQEASYEELLAFAEHRESLAQQIIRYKDQLQLQDTSRLLQLQNYDEVILSRMGQLKLEASNWLFKRGAIRDQRSAYDSRYTPDSMFFDHKK